MPFVEVDVEAERGRHLRIARIAHRPVPVLTHQHRDVADADLEVLEQCVHARVAVDVEVDVRMPVAHQEGLEAQGIRRVARPDQHEAAHGIGDQVRAAEHEGAQEQLAQLGVGLHDVPEVRQVDLEQLGRAQRARADQAVPPGDHVHLPGELPGLVDGDPLLSRAGRARDLDASFQQHVERALGRAALVDHLARREPAPPPDREQARDLRRGELREHLGEPLGRIRHDVEG